MRVFLIGLAAMVGLAGASIAQTPSMPDAAERFGTLESVNQISLSPDGRKLAYIGTAGADQILFVVDLVNGGQPKPISRLKPEIGEFLWCRWASTGRLVCKTYAAVDNAGILLGFTRLMALDHDGKNIVKLTKETDFNSRGTLQDGGSVLDWDVASKPGQILMTREHIPNDRTGSRLGSREEGLGVDLVDTLNLKRERYEGPKDIAVEYITDGHGNVRIMGTQGAMGSGYVRDKIKYFYRLPASKDWKSLSTVGLSEQNEGGFSPVAVDATRNVVYGFDYEKDKLALFSVALDGTGTRKLELSRNDVDVDQLVTIGRNRRVVGASYATERRTIEYFDPELKKLSGSLGRAFPGKPNVDIIDASADENKLLLLAWSDTNPGMFYLYDKTTRQAEELLPVRGNLAGTPLATVKPITYTAADGTAIPGYLTLPVGSNGKGLPAIVMPHGGPASRDEWGFDWLAQFYAARGYAVLQPNFRGSSGYGSAWYQQNGFKSWRLAVGDVNDAGRWLVSEGIAAPGKLAVIGWSYGGYAALQSAVLDPDLYKAIIAIAPVTDLDRLRQESIDFANYPLVDAFIGHGPHVKEGSPAQNVASFKAPVLLFHGTMDQNVGVAQSRLMDSRLREAGKKVTYVEFKGLDHQLPSATARTQMLRDSDVFLRQALGLPAT